ncbi:MAG: T9SS type A sorting domain-containing protein, partial [Bacteroidales bacterium]|nr:T9SS type A sorting domain-containing protein [Bacteroidales bacterium]
GIVEITLPQGYENKEVHIYNIHGTLLQTKQAQATKLSFDLSAYSDGVYIIKIDNYSTRIVKTK